MYPQVFGKYVLERELARGGMARVLLATLRGAGGFEKKLVVKQIRDELAMDDAFVRRFVEEAKTTVALSHPNIVPVYELGVELGTYFLAMEFVEGLSCAELLKACARDGAVLSPEEGAYIGVEVCRALDYAHRRMKVVHRDITPRNVMIDDEGQVKVIDFGIAAPASVSGHEVFGSPGHMAPEQADGKEVTPATDVFAVAVLLLELWSGKAPFRTRDAAESDRKMRGERPRPSDIDVHLLPLDEVIASALSLDPSARPQHADDLARALRKFLSSVDLGDVARGLGDRVRAARAKPVARDTVRPPYLDRPPSRGSGVEIRTKTFAAREEVEKLASDAPPATRKIARSTPPPMQPVKTVSVELETQATKPIETGGERDAPKGRAGWLAAAAVIGIAIVAGAFVLRGAGGGGSAGPAAVSATTATAPVSAPAPSPAPAPASAIPSVLAPAPATALASAPAASLSASSVAAEKATLSLVGDPGTLVAVDGAARGRCPTRVSLDPGSHAVVFTFPTTGESRGQAIVLKPGDRATMRADFTGATPTIRVQR